MNRLIMFPGQMDDVFCMKELKYLVKRFDEVIILAYSGDKKNYDRIAKEYGVRYYIVNNFTLFSLVRCMTPRLLSQTKVLNEIKKMVKLKKGPVNVVKCLAYVFLYINFAANADRIYQKESKCNANDYLYGCWMSRGAFAAAFIHYRDKVKADTCKRAVIKNCVVKAHGYDLYEERRGVNYIPFRRFIYENMENMYFVSRKGCEYYMNKYGWSSEKYHICHLGTDKAYVHKTIKDKKTICIASCSSAWEVKRMDIIIDIIASMRADVQYVHLGDGPLFEDIKQYAEKKLASKNNVKYTFLGRVENADVYKIYDKYDVDFFINMSDSEGLPVSIMEANAFGIPTVCRDIGGNPEIISKENGFVIHYDTDRQEDFYLKIEEFIKCRIEDIDKYKRLSKGALKVWSESFSAEQNYNSFADEVLTYTKM